MAEASGAERLGVEQLVEENSGQQAASGLHNGIRADEVGGGEAVTLLSNSLDPRFHVDLHLANYEQESRRIYTAKLNRSNRIHLRDLCSVLLRDYALYPSLQRDYLIELFILALTRALYLPSLPKRVRKNKKTQRKISLNFTINNNIQEMINLLKPRSEETKFASDESLFALPQCSCDSEGPREHGVDPAVSSRTRAASGVALSAEALSKHLCASADKVLRSGEKHCVQRAMKTVQHLPLIDCQDPAVIKKLTDLHPDHRTEQQKQDPQHRLCRIPAASSRRFSLPRTTIDVSRLCSVIGNDIDNGSSAGASGLSGAHLAALTDFEALRHCLPMVESFAAMIADIVNGVPGGRARALLCRSALVATDKSKSSPQFVPLGQRQLNVRPIAMGEVIYKTAVQYVLSDRPKKHIKDVFPDTQLGVGVQGGSEQAIHRIRQLYLAPLAHPPEQHTNRCVVIATDFKNAFNTMSRQVMLDALLADQHCQELVKLFEWSYGTPSELCCYGLNGELVHKLQSCEGVKQGDGLGSFCWALGAKKLFADALKAAKSRRCKNVEGAVHGVAVLDDFSIVGDFESAFAVFDRLEELAPSYGLELTRAKCKVLLPARLSHAQSHHDDLIASGRWAELLNKEQEVAQQVGEAAEARDVRVVNHLHTLGAVVCDDQSDERVLEHALSVVEDQKTTLRRIAKYMPAQSAMVLLRLCALPRLSYLCRVVPPTMMVEAATKFDALLLEAFCRIAHIRTDRHHLQHQPADTLAESGVEDDSDSDGEISWPYTVGHDYECHIRQPIGKGGFGLRSVLLTSSAAYISSLLVALPSIVHMSGSNTDLTMTASEIDVCMEQLRNKGVTAAQLAEVGLNEWMGPKADEDVEPGTRVRAFAESRDAAKNIKMQQKLTKSIEHNEHQSLLKSLSPSDDMRVRMLDMGVKGASAWLTVLPLASDRFLCIPDDHFRYAVKHALGMSFLPTTADRTVLFKCKFCGQTRHRDPQIVNGQLVQPDHLHCLTCTKYISKLGKTRHDEISRAIGSVVRQRCGMNVVFEPKDYREIVRSQTTDAERPGSDSDDSRTYRERFELSKNNKHGDIFVEGQGVRAYCDVVVTEPCSKSMKRLYGQDLYTIPGVANGQARKRKHIKYDELCSGNKFEMVPVALTTYGAVNEEGEVFFEQIARASIVDAPYAVKSLLRARVSVALQRGNGRMAAAAAVWDTRYPIFQQAASGAQDQRAHVPHDAEDGAGVPMEMAAEGEVNGSVAVPVAEVICDSVNGGQFTESTSNMTQNNNNAAATVRITQRRRRLTWVDRLSNELQSTLSLSDHASLELVRDNAVEGRSAVAAAISLPSESSDRLPSIHSTSNIHSDAQIRDCVHQ
jgi:hypothetical protein